MKKYITAAIIVLTTLPAFAEGFSCPEMAQLIKDLKAEKKAGGMSNVRKDTVNGILSSTRKSYAVSCMENSKTRK